MILPTKYLPENKCLLSVGSRVLELLEEPKSISRIWYELGNQFENGSQSWNYDWFILALDFLYCIGAIIYERELLWRNENDLQSL